MPKTGILLPQKSSNIVNDYLKEKHLSQDAFAEILGVTPKTLYNWLTGKHAIDLDKLQVIVLQIGVGIEDFLDGQEAPKEYYFPEGVIDGVGQISKCGIAAAVGKAYVKLVKLFHEQISFVKFPKRGFFQTFEHDVKIGQNYYFQFWITTEEKIEEAQFILSFTVTNPIDSHYTIRISYGEVIVKADTVEIKQYFQPSDYEVQRPDQQLCLAKVATWFDKVPHTFVVTSKIKFKIVQKGRISEEELKKSSDIAVFWKHFFFHCDE